MADAIQELKLVLSLDTKAYQAGLKGAKASLLGLSSAQVAFGMAAAQYAMRGIDAIVKQYKEYDQALDKLSYQVTDYNKVSRAMMQANVQTTASLRTVGEAAAIYGSRLEMSRDELTKLTAVTAQYADDTGDSAGAMADSVAGLSDRWVKDAGGIASALMAAGQMSGQTISALGAQVMDATPFAKALGMEFEELLAQAVEFKRAGVDFGLYISMMEKNFEKFGGNATEANREIKLISNTVQGFKTQAEAVGFLMEQGFSSRAAIELAEALRSQTQVEIDQTEEEIRKLSGSIEYASATVEKNLGAWEKFELVLKGVMDALVGPGTKEFKNVEDYTKKQFERYSALKTMGYSREEMSRLLESDSAYSMWEKMGANESTKKMIAPGQILKSFPNAGSPWKGDEYLDQLEKQFQQYVPNPVPEKKSEWTMPEVPAIEKMAFTMPLMTDMNPTGWALKAPKPMPYVNNAYGEGGDQKQEVQGMGQMAMGGMASDVDFAAKAVTDMYRVEDVSNRVTKQIKGSFREAFVSAADYADSSSATMRSSLVPAIDGAATGVEEMAVATEQAQQGVSELNQVSEDTRSTWEKVADWAKQAADKMGIDPEILGNNIWTGLARVGKESLLALGVDVDGLTAKVQDFFTQAKGYGLDINQFWEWAQKGTGQTTAQIWNQTLDQMAKATGNFIMQASQMFATGTVDWKELFGGLWRGILASSITALVKMVAEWIAGLEIIAQAKAWLETMPGVGAAIAIGALAVGAVAMLASSKQRTAMADGGLVMGPTNALIGEAGPEAVFPLEKLRDFGIPYGRGSTSSIGSGNSGPIINITVNNPVLNNRTSEKDVRDFMDRMGRQMVRKGGALANSYS